MIEIRSRLRRWGNSFGIVIPQRFIEVENAKEGDEIIVLIKKENETILKEMFGTFNFKKTTAQLIREANQDLYND